VHRILFWSNTESADPWVDKARVYPAHAVEAVVKHLKNGRVHGDGAEQSCILCGMSMPAVEMTDGSVVWPALAQHYVMAHKVWSPQHAWLAERILLHADTPPPHLETSMSEDTSTSDDPWDVDLIDPPDASSNAPESARSVRNDILDADEVGASISDEDDVEDEAEDDVGDDNAGDDDIDIDDDDEGDVDSEEDDNPWDLPEEALQQVTSSLAAPERRRRTAARSADAQVGGGPRRTRRHRRPPPGARGPAATLPSRTTRATAPHQPMNQLVVADGATDSMAAQICTSYPPVSPTLAAKIVSVAMAVGAHPADLANIINFESNQTFDPSVRNPRTGAVGLIQFDPATTTHELGITVDQLAALSAQDQMDWVQVKLDRARNGHPLNTPHRLAMAVFFPPAIMAPERQPLPPAVVAANSGITSSFDYLARMAALARMPGSMPYPPPQYPQGGTTGPQGASGGPEGAGLLDGVVGFFKGLFGGPEQAGAPGASATAPAGSFGAPGGPPVLPPVVRPMARFETDPSLVMRLVEAGGTTSHGPGDVPPGSYRMTIWTGHSWQNMGNLEMVAGKTYRAVSEDGRLKILPS